MERVGNTILKKQPSNTKKNVRIGDTLVYENKHYEMSEKEKSIDQEVDNTAKFDSFQKLKSS